MKNNVTFVIGGCRSGKSDYALTRANLIDGNNKYFIATSVPTDSEMEDRVIKHQNERGKEWHTIEEPVSIHKPIESLSKKADVILIDCLTLWVSNLLFESHNLDGITEYVKKLEVALSNSDCPVYIVSNEVGMGIVPENKLARQFRDYAGFVNQRMAAFSNKVVMTVAGIGVQIKP